MWMYCGSGMGRVYMYRWDETTSLLPICLLLKVLHECAQCSYDIGLSTLLVFRSQFAGDFMLSSHLVYGHKLSSRTLILMRSRGCSQNSCIGPDHSTASILGRWTTICGLKLQVTLTMNLQRACEEGVSERLTSPVFEFLMAFYISWIIINPLGQLLKDL